MMGKEYLRWYNRNIQAENFRQDRLHRAESTADNMRINLNQYEPIQGCLSEPVQIPAATNSGIPREEDEHRPAAYRAYGRFR